MSMLNNKSKQESWLRAGDIGIFYISSPYIEKAVKRIVNFMSGCPSINYHEFLEKCLEMQAICITSTLASQFSIDEESFVKVNSSFEEFIKACLMNRLQLREEA